MLSYGCCAPVAAKYLKYFDDGVAPTAPHQILAGWRLGRVGQAAG